MYTILEFPSYISFITSQYSSFYLHLLDFVSHYAMVWDINPRTRKQTLTAQYFSYNEKTSEFRIPIGFKQDILLLMDELNIEYIIKPGTTIPGRKIEVSLLPEVSPKDYQVPIINTFTQQPSRIGLELQTGKGKTFIAIATVCNLQQATLVVCSSLMTQWQESFCKFTGYTPYIIKGIDSIRKLITMEDPPSVIIASLETLRPYVLRKKQYAKLPLSYPELLTKLKIGIKIIDEIHLNFNATTLLDIASPIGTNFYLSATFLRGNKTEQLIFEKVYPEDIIYKTESIHKYVEAYQYKIDINILNSTVLTERGYAHFKLEKHLLKRITKFKIFYRWLTYALREHFLKIRLPNEKCLLFVATIKMATRLHNWLQREYPNLNCILFVGNTSPDIYKTGDIIISTPKKSGTGRDIAKLRTVINTVSMYSPTSLIQLPGRLRVTETGDPVYVSVHYASLESHRRHYYSELHKLYSRCKFVKFKSWSPNT